MEQMKTVALGDSITYGYPYTPQESWVEHFRRQSGWEVLNAGVSGDTFRDMYARVERDVLAHGPRLVILTGGTNDVYVGLSQPQIRQDFLTLLEELGNSGARVIIGLPLPVEDRSEGPLDLWRRWLRTYCREQNLAVLDFYRDFLDPQGLIRTELLLDGCHPRLSGYEVMGKRAVLTMQELGLIPL